MMLRTELGVRNFQILGFGSSDHQSTFLSHSLMFPNKNSCRFSLQFSIPNKCHKSGLISCKNHSFGKFQPKSYNYQPDDEYVEGSLLISGIYFLLCFRFLYLILVDQ